MNRCIDLFKKGINECVDEVLMDTLRQTWCQEKSSAIEREKKLAVRIAGHVNN